MEIQALLARGLREQIFLVSNFHTLLHIAGNTLQIVSHMSYWSFINSKLEFADILAAVIALGYVFGNKPISSQREFLEENYQCVSLSLLVVVVVGASTSYPQHEMLWTS